METVIWYDKEHVCLNMEKRKRAMILKDIWLDVKAVQEVLGHEHLNTTEIYTHIDNEALRVAARANPLGRVKPKK